MDDELEAELREILDEAEDRIADEIAEASREVVLRLIEREDEAGQLVRDMMAAELRELERL